MILSLFRQRGCTTHSRLAGFFLSSPSTTTTATTPLPGGQQSLTLFLVRPTHPEEEHFTHELVSRSRDHAGVRSRFTPTVYSLNRVHNNPGVSNYCIINHDKSQKHRHSSFNQRRCTHAYRVCFNQLKHLFRQAHTRTHARTHCRVTYTRPHTATCITT